MKGMSQLLRLQAIDQRNTTTPVSIKKGKYWPFLRSSAKGLIKSVTQSVEIKFWFGDVILIKFETCRFWCSLPGSNNAVCFSCFLMICLLISQLLWRRHLSTKMNTKIMFINVGKHAMVKKKRKLHVKCLQTRSSLKKINMTCFLFWVLCRFHCW